MVPENEEENEEIIEEQAEEPAEAQLVAGTPIDADGTPDDPGLYEGLAQVNMWFHQSIEEVVDNSIAAVDGDKEKIKVQIDISEAGDDDKRRITIVDNSGGIPLLVLRDRVFRTGKKAGDESHGLNEHGFGLKNVLSKVQSKGPADNQDDLWVVHTRPQETKDLQDPLFLEVKSPLTMKPQITPRAEVDWPTNYPEWADTAVSFTVPMTYMGTVSEGKKGANVSTLAGISALLREHIGVTYRNFLVPTGGVPSPAIIQTSVDWSDPSPIAGVKPEYNAQENIPETSLVAYPDVSFKGKIGKIANNFAPDNGCTFYYQENQRTQGVDLVIGNRTIYTQLLTEIWDVERHPSYNCLVGEIHVEFSNNQAWFKTTNNKTAMDQTDPIWLALVEGINGAFSKTSLPKDASINKTEKEMKDALQTTWEQQYGSIGGTVHPENPIFQEQLVKADFVLLLPGDQKIVVECKQKSADPSSIYQLRMYWDGYCVSNGESPTIGWLIAESAPDHVQILLALVNTWRDPQGNQYAFEFKSWADLGVQTGN